ncbi:uncharacterized protein si:dkey-237j10.2 [Entelurus aequoreus]|uniref:uncharacterized protein si:dkey-237j10.2 n=1 Tax=Entelurus aequoreus TaxID=161455 RepID=UPI002B1DE124|nr:uncharacterized protein si:dkey-237j10.2 [Entelurus aequoreus]
MLGEGFLQALCYREERNGASASMGHKLETTQTDIQQRGLDQGVREHRYHGLRLAAPDATSLSISGCLSDLTLCSGPCSLLQHYPDLQVADSVVISHNPLKTNAPQQDLFTQSEQNHLLCESVPSLSSDQGYLVMGDDANTSLGMPASQLEPMSNSLLNGLLEKKLDEVYVQHLTDNLARCNSQLENSLLHGLVPPLQPNERQQGEHSLESNLDEGPGGECGKKFGYLSNLNLAPCSSNFSTPVLRISEDVHPK